MNTRGQGSRVNRGRVKKINLKILIPVLILVVIITTIILQKSLGGKIVIIPGKLSYDESLTDEEKSLLEDIFTEDVKLPSDAKITAKTEPTIAQENGITFDILVPVTTFNSSISNISEADMQQNDSVNLESIKELDNTKKLLSLDEKYFFDNFKSGAKFRNFYIESSNSQFIIDKIKPEIKNLPTSDNTLSINQTGVTALSRGMQTMLNKQGKNGAYFADRVKDFLNKTDYTHISNEVSFDESCQVSSGSVVLCSPLEMMDSIKAIGTDIVELTGNHNNDWSPEANIKSIEMYEQAGFKTFGGGKDEESAAIPLQLEDKGTKITWLGYNQSTSTKENGQGANGSKPGANIYSEEKAKSDITQAKERGDFVIVDIQYFECYSYPDEGQEMPSCDAPISGQEAFFKQFIDWGADMVVGTQAHQPQTFELYNNKPIYYGLGNLFFDQIYWPGTQRGIILTHYFMNGKLLQTRFSPTFYDKDLQVYIMNDEDTKAFIDRLNRAL